MKTRVQREGFLRNGVGEPLGKRIFKTRGDVRPLDRRLLMGDPQPDDETQFLCTRPVVFDGVRGLGVSWGRSCSGRQPLIRKGAGDSLGVK